MQVVRQRCACLVDCRTAAAGERCFVDAEGVEEGGARAVGEQRRPHHLHIDRRIAGAGGTPIDDAAQPAVAHETVPLEVALHPHGRTAVRRRSPRLLPHRHGGGRVDQVARAVDRLARRLVVLLQRPGPVARRRGIVGRRGLELADDLGEVAREGDRVVESVERGALARYPAVHRPPVRIAVGGLTDGNRLGHGDRDVRGETRQPACLRLDLSRRPVNAGKAHHEVVAQSPDRVVGTPRLDDGEPPIGERRHLRREKTMHERVVDLDLVVVHPHRHEEKYRGRSNRRRADYRRDSLNAS